MIPEVGTNMWIIREPHNLRIKWSTIQAWAPRSQVRRKRPGGCRFGFKKAEEILDGSMLCIIMLVIALLARWRLCPCLDGKDMSEVCPKHNISLLLITMTPFFRSDSTNYWSIKVFISLSVPLDITLRGLYGSVPIYSYYLHRTSTNEATHLRNFSWISGSNYLTRGHLFEDYCTILIRTVSSDRILFSNPL